MGTVTLQLPPASALGLLATMRQFIQVNIVRELKQLGCFREMVFKENAIGCVPC